VINMSYVCLRNRPKVWLISALGFSLGSLNHLKYSLVRECYSGRGFGLDIGLTDHLYTQLVRTSNYSAIANLHILQITNATANFLSQPAMSSPDVPW
jgi:hypothetical protein